MLCSEHTEDLYYSNFLGHTLTGNTTVVDERPRADVLIGGQTVGHDSVITYNVRFYYNESYVPTSFMDDVAAQFDLTCGDVLDASGARAVLDGDVASMASLGTTATALLEVINPLTNLALIDGDKVPGGLDSLWLRVTITTVCRSITSRIAIVVNAPEDDRFWLIKKYAHRYLAVDTTILKTRYTFGQHNVHWYDISNGEMVPVKMGGYVYSNEQPLVGKFYVVIEAKNEDDCDMILHSDTVDWRSSAHYVPVELTPNYIHYGETMILSGLDGMKDTDIECYDIVGKRQFDIFSPSEENTPGGGKTEIAINTAEHIYLPPGVYFIWTRCGDVEHMIRFIVY